MPDLNEDKLQAVPVEPGQVFSFSVLGRNADEESGIDVHTQTRNDLHWSVRKACATLKITSAIMNAIVVHPGGDADDKELSEATRELLQRSVAITDAAISILDVQADPKTLAGYRNILRQQATEIVATQWRMSHTMGVKPLDVDQLTDAFKAILEFNPLHGDGEGLPYPSDIDAITARRVSLLAVAPDIFQAIASYDFYAPKPQSLVENGVRKVIEAAELGIKRLVSDRTQGDSANIIMQSLIHKTGTLYASNYRAFARQNITMLQQMEPLERAAFLDAHKQTGLPTAHIDTAFTRLYDRMVTMVCDAIPEVPLQFEQEAKKASTRHAEQSSQPG